MKRTIIKIAGESGMGLVSVGMIIAKALKRMGFYLVMDREYPSLIKGGHSNLQIDFDDEPLHALSTTVDIVVALDRAGLEEYVKVVRKGGVLIHGYEKKDQLKDLETFAEERGVKLLYLPARQVAYSFGGNELMVNMVLLGMLWKTLGFPLSTLESFVQEQFADKPKLLEMDLECVRTGYVGEFQDEKVNFPKFGVAVPKKKHDTILVDGNLAIALGAVHCGVRAYYVYPMSPSSSIFTHLANFSCETKMIIKQAEDEITAAQMAIGSMFMGTRALVATSGGGYDLMTETVSLAGMTETPLVIVLAQRPGPATGLPTWTAQADLDLAVYGGHGEFARIVLGCSDPVSCFELVQHAMNLAERYQTLVVILTEKVICETQVTVPHFEQKKIPIERGLVPEKKLSEVVAADRFRITDSGVSKRWVPAGTETFYFGNGDEHREDGTLTEEADECRAMYAKRMRKLKTIEEALPEPEVFGAKKGAKISFVGWGSTKNVMMDVIKECDEKGIKVNYLHYEYLHPVKVKRLVRFLKENKNVCLIEGNYTGQLGELLKARLQDEGVLKKFEKRFLKYDGRPFFVEEVCKFVKNNI